MAVLVVFCLFMQPYSLFFFTPQVCSSVFNSWEQFKDHLVTHTGDKPNHCTICDQWFTQPSDLHIHLQEHHGIQEKIIISEEVIISDPATVFAMTEVEEGEERVILEDAMRVEHVTVEPVDVVAVEETLVVEEEMPIQPSQIVGGVEETLVLQVDDERLKEQAIDLQIAQVTDAECEVILEAVDCSKKVKTANIWKASPVHGHFENELGRWSRPLLLSHRIKIIQ